MHKRVIYQNRKLNFSSLEPILTEMGVFVDLKRKKIRFNPHLLTRSKNKKEKHVDLHLEVTRKIDEVIAKNSEHEQTIEDKKIEIPKFIEIREPAFRSPETPTFQSDINRNAGFGDLNNIVEFVEIEPPANFSMEKMPENKDGFDSWMINNENEKAPKTFWGFGRIKLRTKDSPPPKTTTSQKTNETTIAKIELEETKIEIERKKKELEEVLKKEKEKLLQVKKEEDEKKKLEKLMKIDLKKKIKEEKIKQKLELKTKIEIEKAQKENELQLKKLELLKGKQVLGQPMTEPVVEELKPPFNIPQGVDVRRENIHGNFDEDVAKLLPIIDSLFEKLPEEVVDEFTNSEYFELYEKVLLKYKNK